MASDPGTSHADLQTTKQTAWEGGETLFQDCGCQTLVHPTQTHRHPKKLHERKEKPVHHGFLNKEAYPPLQDHGHQTLVHPTQTCRHPNNSPERMGKPVLHGFNNWLFLWIFIREVIIYLVSVKNEIGYRIDVTVGHQINFIPLFSYLFWTVVLCLTTS